MMEIWQWEIDLELIVVKKVYIKGVEQTKDLMAG